MFDSSGFKGAFDTQAVSASQCYRKFPIKSHLRGLFSFARTKFAVTDAGAHPKGGVCSATPPCTIVELATVYKSRGRDIPALSSVDLFDRNRPFFREQQKSPNLVKIWRAERVRSGVKQFKTVFRSSSLHG